jgi:hypothetical protein
LGPEIRQTLFAATIHVLARHQRLFATNGRAKEGIVPPRIPRSVMSEIPGPTATEIGRHWNELGKWRYP